MFVIALFVMQTGTAGIVVGPGQTKVTLTARAADDSTRARRDSLRRATAAAHPIITPAILASAYADASARSLISRAREARLSQDSSIQNYEATTYQRLTTKLGLSHLALDRMLFRYESTSRVRWQRGAGASVEITGRRAAAPSIGDAEIDIDDIQSPVPYFPGRDALWAGSSVVKDEIKTDDLIHPLATAAEAYYIYQ